MRVVSGAEYARRRKQDKPEEPRPPAHSLYYWPFVMSGAGQEAGLRRSGDRTVEGGA